MRQCETQMITRRFFIAGAVSFGAFHGLRAFAAPSDFGLRRRGNLRFGVISDIHVALSLKDGVTPNGMPRIVEDAFRYFRDQGVDAVVIPGDLASFGTVAELWLVADAWNRTFPDGKLPDGRRVERIFVMGNHDWEGWRYSGFADKFLPDPADRLKNVLALDRERHWREVFGEDFRQFNVKTVNGYDFIQAHFIGNEKGRSRLTEADCHRGIREFYAAYRPDPHRPFFHIQHPMPKNTCYGPWGWGRDNGDSVSALSAFPCAVSFSGHSHYPISDERAIWQGAFTSIGCGTLAAPSRTPGRAGLDLYDSSAAFDIENVKRDSDIVSVMDVVESNANGRCALLVDVYDDKMRISRLQMPARRTIGYDWVVPLGDESARPFAFVARAKKALAPEFPSTARLVVEKTEVKGRAGIALTFPVADAIRGARAYEYEVTVVGDGGERSVHRVLPPGYNGSEEDPAAALNPHCELALDRLPKSSGRLRFEVRPRECFGRTGRAIAAELSCG